MISVLRITILVLSLAAMVIWLIWARKQYRFGYALPALLWLANVILFQIARLKFFSLIAVTDFNVWSLAIQLQGALTLLLLGWFFMRWHNGRE